MRHHICPRCHLTVAEERLHLVPFVCDSCGYTATPDNTKQIDHSDSRLMIKLAGLGVLAFVLISSNVEMRWLQARDYIGLSSLQSLERLEKVCSDLRKSSCVEKALARQAERDPKRTAKYADYLMKHLRFKDALVPLKKYIAKGSFDVNDGVLYARALAETGQIDEAVKYFERALAVTSPSMEHIQTYVRYLSRAKRFDQALSLILRVRRTKLNALPVEYRIISEMRSAVSDRVMASKR